VSHRGCLAVDGLVISEPRRLYHRFVTHVVPDTR